MAATAALADIEAALRRLERGSYGCASNAEPRFRWNAWKSCR
jgi:hypothetical protein